jgi:putative transposase
VKVQRGYKTEIKPNNKQRTLLLKNAGAARWTYNWGLNQKKMAYENGEKTPNAIELHRRLNTIKSTELPWMYDWKNIRDCTIISMVV